MSRINRKSGCLERVWNNTFIYNGKLILRHGQRKFYGRLLQNLCNHPNRKANIIFIMDGIKLICYMILRATKYQQIIWWILEQYLLEVYSSWIIRKITNMMTESCTNTAPNYNARHLWRRTTVWKSRGNFCTISIR